MSSVFKTSDTSPQTYARIGGTLYLIIILAGIFGELFVRGKMIVSGDAAATASNIIANQFLWRMGIAVDLIMHVCDIPVMVVFYLLLKPVNKNLALLALVFNLIQTAVLAANKLNLLAALFPLGTAEYLKAIGPAQLYAQSYLSLKLHDYGFGVGLIFFGFVCLIVGNLIFRSGYLPKVLGVLMQIAGVCYLINSFTLILAPQYTNMLILLPCLIAELSVSLWFIFKGVDVAKWNLASQS